MKSICVMAVYTICRLMLSSCWPGMYRTLRFQQHKTYVK